MQYGRLPVYEYRKVYNNYMQYVILHVAIPFGTTKMYVQMDSLHVHFFLNLCDAYVQMQKLHVCAAGFSMGYLRAKAAIARKAMADSSYMLHALLHPRQHISKSHIKIL